MDATTQEVIDTTVSTKRLLRNQLPNYSEVFDEVETHIRQEVDRIREKRERGESVIPQIDYSALTRGDVSAAQVQEIRRRGAVVVQQTFSREQAKAWNDQLGEYLIRNNYYETGGDAPSDSYFSNLDADRPQIFSVYWSKPQVQARQAERMATTRAFLNSLWTRGRDGETYFDPDRECTYADRIRRREPGDTSLGLSPHMDAGSVERWLDPGYRKVYRHVFSGNWREFDLFDGAHRTEVEEISSSAVCSMFRTYQGWTALTPQGPGDGTLQLIPIATGIVYVLLRALQDDVPDDELCGARPGRALPATDEWHEPLLPALTTIARVEPGDTVFWHPDVVHAVEDEHEGTEYSNVIYIGAAPYCDKNAAYLERQKPAFLKGESPPDFAPDHYETTYEGRATLEDLTDLGKRQMGILPW